MDPVESAGARAPAPPRHRSTPARLAGAYLVLGLAWVFLSDRALARAGLDPAAASRAHTASMTGFLGLTAGLMYWLVRRELREVARAQDLARAIVDGTADAVFIKDRAGRYLMLSNAASRMVGKPVAEILGRDDTFLFDTESAARIMSHDRLVVESARPWLGEEVITANGVTRTFQATKAPYLDADGNVVGVIGIARDITDQSRAEAAARASEERASLARQAGRVGVFDWDVVSGRSFWTEELEVIYGLAPGGFDGGHEAWARRVHPEDYPRVLRDLEATFRERRAEDESEYRIVRPDGETRWITNRGRIYYDASGQPTRVVGTTIDITERKRADAFLARQNAVLERVATGAPLAEVLGEIVAMVEEQLPGLVSSILLLDRDGAHLRVAAAPGLPPEYNAAVDGVAIGPRVGSCGTAAHRGEPVAVADIATDPLWEGYSHLALAHGLRACWSTPILSLGRGGRRQVLGTFAVYARQPCLPDPRYTQLMARAEHLARVAIESDLADRELRESEARFRTFVDHAADALCLHDERGVVLDVNRQACVSLGYSREELIGMTPADFDPDVTPESLRRTLAELRRGEVVAFDSRHRRKDGTVFPVEVRMRPFEIGGRRLGLALVRDVTQRKRAETALRESEERYRRLVEVLPSAVMVHDGERVTYGNPAFRQLIGATDPGDYLGQSPLDFASPDYHDLARARIQQMRQTGQPVPGVESRVVRRDGRVVPVHCVATPLAGPGQPAFLVVFHDLTERERSMGLLQSVLGSVADAIVTADEHGVIRSANAATERMFGYPADDLVGRDFSDLTSEGARLSTFLPDGAAALGHGRETTLRRQDGTTFPGEVTLTEFHLAGVRHFTGVIRDVSERKRLEEQVRQAQKMEAVGRLAGGVAHDFNNLLTVILGFTEVALAETPPADPRREPLTTIRSAGDRAAGLTHQLLAFSRKAIIAPKVLDLNEVVDSVGKMLRRLIGEDVTLVTSLSPRLSSVKADPGQLEQVIVNLAVNARDAMPKGGRLTIETRDVEVRRADLARYPELKPGRHVLLAMSDTGGGMTEEVRARIFEPFFTTKEVGKGTGLGLATVFGIVLQAGGHVGVESAVGQGTTFTVLLPAVLEPRPAAVPAADREALRGAETILLVEDEEAVRRLARLALEMHGYVVLEAASGADAMRAEQAHAGPIHLLLTDVVMPGLGGRDLADAVRGRRPGVRVLYMSGYTDDAVVRHGVIETADAFLQKPFTPLGLARKVRAVLDVSA